MHCFWEFKQFLKKKKGLCSRTSISPVNSSNLQRKMSAQNLLKNKAIFIAFKSASENGAVA